MMRGSRMRDRRPPSYLWNCGTRAAKLQPATGDPDGVNTPFFFLFRTTCPTSPSAARPRSGPLTTALARHVRPSAVKPSNLSLLRAVRRHADNYFCCPLNPFLAMSETIVPTATNVYHGRCRFLALVAVGFRPTPYAAHAPDRWVGDPGRTNGSI